MVFVSDSEQPTLTRGLTEITLEVPFSLSNPGGIIPERLGDRAQDEKQSTLGYCPTIAAIFAETFAENVASCAERLGVHRLVLLAPHRFHRFSGAPSIQRTPQQNAGRLETDGASQPIQAFVFLKDYILIGF